MKKELLLSVLLALGLGANAQTTDVEVASGQFSPDWNSLSAWECPEWFKDAKFGIWAHWGPQCHAEAGDWYARFMYYQGSGQYNWHVNHFGNPKDFGLKDLCNDWKAQNWNAEELVNLYKSVGARYFMALGNHHDNFDLWNSPYQEWNSVNVGPKKDLVGGWREACKKAGLPLGVSIHASHAWTWLEPSQNYDGNLTKEDGAGQWWEGMDPQAIEYADKSADYLITGINQRLERMGRTIYMSSEGAQKIYSGDPEAVYKYIISVRDGMDYDQLKERLDKLAEEKDIDINCQNYALSMEGTMGSVTTGMSLMCMAISVITILIVIFVESLVIRAKISHEWRGMGISKALGQTGGGLIKQIMLSNMPAITAGAILGASLATPAGSAAVRAAFSLFVIKNISFTISPVWMILSVTGIVAVALLTSAVAGLKVRQLRPAEMICED